MISIKNIIIVLILPLIVTCMEIEKKMEYQKLDCDFRSLNIRELIDLVELQVRNKNINILDKNGRTLLYEVIRRKYNVELVKKLLEANVDVNITVFDNNTVQAAIFLCIDIEDSTEIVELLVKHGANINSTLDEEISGKKTLLMKATEKNNIKLVEFLLQQPGIAINALDAWGHTALFYTSDYFELFKILIEHGADTAIRTDDNATCFDYYTPEIREEKQRIYQEYKMKIRDQINNVISVSTLCNSVIGYLF